MKAILFGLLLIAMAIIGQNANAMSVVAGHASVSVAHASIAPHVAATESVHPATVNESHPVSLAANPLVFNGVHTQPQSAASEPETEPKSMLRPLLIAVAVFLAAISLGLIFMSR